ncbi:hypothetical protein [Bacillus atrophaeus]|uniref:hypothetical protein n=1 Tax=Bacillus atrophaeus TaxID=1452 RepID=UPI00399067AE
MQLKPNYFTFNGIGLSLYDSIGHDKEENDISPIDVLKSENEEAIFGPFGLDLRKRRTKEPWDFARLCVMDC